MYGFIFGFQRRVWCPKCAPASRSSFMLTVLMGDDSLPPEGGHASTCEAEFRGSKPRVRRRFRRRGGARAPPPSLQRGLALAELEPLARSRVAVDLALDLPGIPGQQAVALESLAQLLVVAQ